jgi:hypothetical protein
MEDFRVKGHSRKVSCPIVLAADKTGMKFRIYDREFMPVI